MKKIFCLLSLLIVTCGFSYAQITPKVDERFELTSIAFRISEAPEYSGCKIIEYANSIDEHFGRFKEHELIKYIKILRNSQAVSYDAVASSTNILCIDNGKIIIAPNVDIDLYLQSEKRWTAQSLNKYLELLNDFYRDTDFHSFFDSHKTLRTSIEESYASLITDIDFDWFKSFFGVDKGDPQIFLSMTNGPCNYALVGVSHPYYGILVGYSDDIIRNAYNYGNNIQIVLHELCHNFTNPLFFKYIDEFVDAGNKIYSYPFVGYRMADMAYGNGATMTLEWLTNLFSFMCLNDCGSLNHINESSHSGCDRLALKYESFGYIWMIASIDFMEKFNKNRDTYPTIESYIPELARFYNEVANDFDTVMADFINKHPYVVKTTPDIVTNDDTEVVVTFSAPMRPSSGLHPIDGVQPLPISDYTYWRDSVNLVIPLNKHSMDANINYGIALNSMFFSSELGYGMIEDYNIVTNKIN